MGPENCYLSILVSEWPLTLHSELDNSYTDLLGFFSSYGLKNHNHKDVMPWESASQGQCGCRGNGSGFSDLQKTYSLGSVNELLHALFHTEVNWGLDFQYGINLWHLAVGKESELMHGTLCNHNSSTYYDWYQPIPRYKLLEFSETWNRILLSVSLESSSERNRVENRFGKWISGPRYRALCTLTQGMEESEDKKIEVQQRASLESSLLRSIFANEACSFKNMKYRKESHVMDLKVFMWYPEASITFYIVV